MQIVLVAAVGENNAIGIEGQLPWHISSDLRHFRALTINRPVIMGRKTFESVGKPLDQRTNIVVSRSLERIASGVVLATSVDAAMGVARTDAEKRKVDEIMVIGGGDIFAALMSRATRLEITHVHASPEGDSFFPEIDPQQWEQQSRREMPAGPKDSARFALATYVRRRQSG
jgi:dihydrofolate reductase